MNTASPARALFTSISKKSWARCISSAECKRVRETRLARQKQKSFSGCWSDMPRIGIRTMTWNQEIVLLARGPHIRK